MKNSLLDALKSLRLSGMARSLDLRLQEARGNSLAPEEFLELILQDELHVRGERLIARRLKAACFRELKTLDDFDWRFNTSIKRKAIYDLAACDSSASARTSSSSARPAWAKRTSGPGHRLRGHQGRLLGPLPLDLRPGPGLPARRGVGRRGTHPGQVPQARPAHH